jgi:transglutaminase-like putative cysteine protease
MSAVNVPFIGRALSSLRPSLIHTSATNSDKSVADTIVRMREIVRISQTSPIVLYRVQEATAGLQSTATDRDVVRAIFYWIKGHIVFTQDETLNQNLGMSSFDAEDTELLITPDALLSMQTPQGDCDDFSMLAASMLGALNFNCAFVTIAADSSMSNVFSHVYLKVWLVDENKGMYFDCSHGLYPGWEHAAYTRKLEWKI